MDTIKAFKIDGLTFSITVTDAPSTSVTIGSKVYENVRVCNDGFSTAFIAIGVGNQVATIPTDTATKTCTPILPGCVEVFSLPRVLALEIAAICKTGETTTLYIQHEEGI